MQARDLASPYPTVRVDADGLTAARLLTEHNRPGLIVVDEHEHPIAVLPGSQVLRMLIPRYVQDDPTLARVLDEESADKLPDELRNHKVRDLMTTDSAKLVIVNPDDTVLEIAAIMAANRCPLAAVVEDRNKTAPMIGAISVSDLLGRVLPSE
jgi:CBS-domain-containing membrane protein